MNAENMLDRLLKQLEQRGLSVVPDGAGGLKVRGPKAEVTPGVLDALKAFKPQLIKRFAAPQGAAPVPAPAAKVQETVECLDLCDLCGRDVSDPEDRARLADPLFCTAFGSPGLVDGTGRIHPKERRCPYKPNRR